MLLLAVNEERHSCTPLAMVVFFGTNLFIDFAMYGSYLTLFLVFAMGAFCMISMGLVIAARIASEELAEGC